MSESPFEVMRAQAVSLPCGYCGAKPGHWCVIRPGNKRAGAKAQWLHGARERPVRKAFWAGDQYGVENLFDTYLNNPGLWKHRLARYQRNLLAERDGR